VGRKCECSTGQERMTTLRCASQSRSLLVEGAIRFVLSTLFPTLTPTCQCWRLTCCSVTEMVITDSTWTKRSMKGHPLVARRSTMTLSVQTQAQVKVAMIVMLAPPRLNASVWRSGALGYHHDMTRHDVHDNALHGTCWGPLRTCLS
jgi:hypothetical protein